MLSEIAKQPVATVTGLYRGKFGGLDPLTINTPSPGTKCGAIRYFMNWTCTRSLSLIHI